MPINMTQKFSFETDDLESLEKMLRAIVPILFSETGYLGVPGSHCQRTKESYIQLFMRTKEPAPYSWNNGRGYAWDNGVMRKSKLLGHNSSDVVIGPTETYHGAPVYAVIETAPTIEDACVKACALNEKERKGPSRKFICMLMDYKSDCKPEDQKAPSYDALCRLAMEQVKSASEEKFLEEFEEPEWMRGDGTVRAGYRLHWEPMGGWNKLLLSMIHVYYGK